MLLRLVCISEDIATELMVAVSSYKMMSFIADIPCLKHWTKD